MHIETDYIAHEPPQGNTSYHFPHGACDDGKHAHNRRYKENRTGGAHTECKTAVVVTSGGRWIDLPLTTKMLCRDSAAVDFVYGRWPPNGGHLLYVFHVKRCASTSTSTRGPIPLRNPGHTHITHAHVHLTSARTLHARPRRTHVHTARTSTPRTRQTRASCQHAHAAPTRTHANAGYPASSPRPEHPRHITPAPRPSPPK